MVNIYNSTDPNGFRRSISGGGGQGKTGSLGTP